MSVTAQSDSAKLTREEWLNKLAALMAPRFEELSAPLPKFRVSIGWTGGGHKEPATGECWSPKASADEHFEIFLSPKRADSIKVACTLAHELTHAAVGLECGHKGEFSRVARGLGFAGQLTVAQQPPALVAWIQPLIDTLGPLPHAPMLREITAMDDSIAAITAQIAALKKAGKPVDGIEQPEAPDETHERANSRMNNRPPKQSTRMHKCQCETCGYTARVSAKWLKDAGGPICPVGHGPMDYDVGEVEK